MVSWPDVTPGAAIFTIQATGPGGADQESWTVTVALDAPTVTAIDDTSAAAGTPWTGPIASVSDPICAGTVTWSLVGASSGMSIDSLGQISWDAPVPGSVLRTVGLFDAQDSQAGGTSVAYEVRYEVRSCQICSAPFGNAGGLGGVDVLVSVYEANGRKDLNRPLRMLVRRHYSARSRTDRPRGL